MSLGDASLLHIPALEHFDGLRQSMGVAASSTHEVATKIGDEIVSAGNLSFEAQEDGRTYIPRWAGEHKKEIAIVLTVGGVLFAINQLRIRRKNS